MAKKFKSKKSVVKRFKVTGKGKIKVRKQSGRSHLMGSKSAKRKRQLKDQPILKKTQELAIKRMLGI
ncbi:MAG: 50S ribosomal protein L35 [bacterium]